MFVHIICHNEIGPTHDMCRETCTRAKLLLVTSTYKLYRLKITYLCGMFFSQSWSIFLIKGNNFYIPLSHINMYKKF
jgi:hypothetical protein